MAWWIYRGVTTVSVRTALDSVVLRPHQRVELDGDDPVVGHLIAIGELVRTVGPREVVAVVEVTQGAIPAPEPLVEPVVSLEVELADEIGASGAVIAPDPIEGLKKLKRASAI